MGPAISFVAQHGPSYRLAEVAQCSHIKIPLSLPCTSIRATRRLFYASRQIGRLSFVWWQEKRMKRIGLATFLFLSAIIHTATVDHSLAASNSSLDICNIVACGKGTCNHTSSGRILEDFIPTCECDQGWKQPNVGISIPFLPCVIPDCNLDFSCSGKAPASAPAPLSAQNDSTNALHPCSYAVCGEGICNRTSDYGYSCNCDEGYENLLNITSAPCVRECSIGADCKNLGFAVGGNGTTSAPVQSNAPNTEGTSSAPPNTSGVVGFVKHIPYLMTTAMVITLVCWR